MFMMKRLNYFIILFAASALNSCSPSQELSGTIKSPVKNIILMIGDGMGLSDVYAAMTVSGSDLNFSKCNYTGLQTNYSNDNYVTDSGASGTALATGTKTNNGSIGVDANGNPVKSILEIAEENGLATGLVSTSALTHATPASFIAHQSSRGSYDEIARDFLKTDVDVIIGGGYNNFGKRSDNINLLDSLKAHGYQVASNMQEVLKASDNGKLAGFTAPFHNPYRLKGRGDMLPESTSKAISILSKNKKGFFLMVEGSQIDFAGHANAQDTLVDEVLDFNDAIGRALSFAAQDGNTLVIVTADHETGGVTLVGGNRANRTVKMNFSTKDHTGVMIPVYAFGPGSEKFTGMYDNTDIFKKMKAAFGF
jgi:alkaline phosphatase